MKKALIAVRCGTRSRVQEKSFHPQTLHVATGQALSGCTSPGITVPRFSSGSCHVPTLGAICRQWLAQHRLVSRLVVGLSM